MGNYDGKRVVITGGASGIGFATAKLLVTKGSQVLITGRNESALERARQDLGKDAIAVVSNTASLADIDVLADRVKSEFGTFHLLLANAGVAGFVPLDNVTEEGYDEMMAVNSKGPFFTVQHLAPMIAEGGSIVLTTSVANVLGMAYSSVYAASKAALRSMARTLARELLQRGIRVNAVSPGPIATGILEKMMDKEAADQTKRQMSDDNPMKRFGRPEEVAKAVLFLGFEATYTTGAELVVDGGGSQL